MEFSKKTLFNEEVIKQRILELGRQITDDYNGEEIFIIGVLKGSFVFLADLIRTIQRPIELEFIGISSYEGTSSTGHVKITRDLSVDIAGKNLLLVEDIVDTGITLDYIINLLKVRKPSSIKVCTLLSKPHAHKMKYNLDYVGFEISNEFVIGYGLDYNEKYRELPYICQVILWQALSVFRVLIWKTENITNNSKYIYLFFVFLP